MTTYALQPPLLTAIIGADGVGTTSSIGPTVAGESWNVARYSVSLRHSTIDAPRGKLSVYKGFVSPANLIDYTPDGDGATSENNSINLMLGETIIFQWTDATVGAIGTVNMSGERSIPGRRGYAVPSVP